MLAVDERDILKELIRSHKSNKNIIEMWRLERLRESEKGRARRLFGWVADNIASFVLGLGLGYLVSLVPLLHLLG